MAEEKKNITYAYIGNALRSAAADGVTTFADEVFDTERQEYQQDINSMVAKETENPEFIYFFADADDRLLWWINVDGSVDWASGVPQPVQVELIRLENLIKENLEGDENLKERVAANEEAIVAINEALDRKVDGIYVDSPEFLRYYCDADDRLLWWINADGSVDWGRGVPQPIQVELQRLEQLIKNNNDSVTEQIEAINNYLNEALAYKESPEYIKMLQDADDRIISAVTPDGTNYLPKADIEELSLDGEAVDNDAVKSQVYTESPEFISYTTDGDDRVLEGFKSDGTKYINNIETKNVKAENIESNSVNTTTFSIKGEIIDNDAIKSSYYVDNHEYINIEEDIDGRILGYTKSDGSHYIRNVESESIPTEFSNCEDEEERIEVKKDADGRILSELTKKGKTIFHSGISSPEIDDIYNKLESIPSSNNVKSIVESEPVKYGAESKGAFSTLTNTSYYVTVENIVTGTRGWLTSIGIYCSAGNKTFAIGYIDQRNWAIVRKEFTVNAPSYGYNEIDISNEHIIIEKDEKLFVVANGIGYLPLTEESSQPQMIYGSKAGVLERYNGYGATMYFNWSVTDVNALYPFIEDFENVTKSVNNVQEKANELYNNNNIIYDNFGNPYKIKVVDGNIMPILQRFKNVVVLGNSVTKHGYSTLESTMWLSSDKGMAATIVDNDFCHLLQEGLRTYFNDAITHPYGVAGWERSLDTNEDNINAFLPDIGNVDMVITAISENMTSNDVNEVQNAFEVLLKCIANKYQNAEIVVTSTRLLIGGNLSAMSNRDIAMFNAAKKFKCKYIDVRQNKFDAFCSNFNTGEWIPMFINGDSDVFPVQKAVFSHTSDIGMLRIANAILKDIGYNQLTDKIYNISMSANQEVYCPAYWVEKGLVTCLCYDSIPSSATVISDDVNIETRIVDFSTITLYATPSKMPKAAVIFTMPKNNVSLTIN